MIRSFARTLTLAVALAAAGGAYAQDKAASLAEIRGELESLAAQIQSLKSELVNGGPAAMQAAGGASALDRMNALEAELARLTSQTEKLQIRVEKVVEIVGPDRRRLILERLHRENRDLDAIDPVVNAPFVHPGVPQGMLDEERRQIAFRLLPFLEIVIHPREALRIAFGRGRMPHRQPARMQELPPPGDEPLRGPPADGPTVAARIGQRHARSDGLQVRRPLAGRGELRHAGP